MKDVAAISRKEAFVIARKVTRKFGKYRKLHMVKGGGLVFVTAAMHHSKEHLVPHEIIRIVMRSNRRLEMDSTIIVNDLTLKHSLEMTEHEELMIQRYLTKRGYNLNQPEI